ncbi:MAG: WcaI family glycosyltransferase [Opitutales bacterium]
MKRVNASKLSGTRFGAVTPKVSLGKRVRPVALFLGLLFVATIVFVSVKNTPYMRDLPWLPSALADWADHNPNRRTFLPFFFAAFILPLVTQCRWRMRWTHLCLSAGGLLATLGITELLQWPMPMRSAAWSDIGWGATGIAAGLFTAVTVWLLSCPGILGQQRDSLAPRLLIWGINYTPEMTGIAPYNAMLAEWFSRRGWQVEVLTSFAYYPQWKREPSDRGFLFRRENDGKAAVHRVWAYVPQQVTTLKRIVHEASFVGLSFIRALFLRRPNLVFVGSPPLSLGVAAWAFHKLRGAPFVFHVYDLQPDAAVGLGMLKGSHLVKTLYQLESFAYSKAVRVTGITSWMLDTLREKGVPEDKLFYFPNSAVLPKDREIPERGAFRRRHNIDEDTFVALYSGNLGQKQGLDILTDAASLLASEEKILIVICGEGAKKQDLLKSASDRKLSNVLFLPLQPKAHFWEMLVDCDTTLVTQQANSGAAFFPSKLLTILSLKRPAVTVADHQSALYLALAEGEFGQNVLPGDAEALAKILKELKANPEALDTMARNGRKYVAQFAKEANLSRVETEFRGIATQGALVTSPKLSTKS